MRYALISDIHGNLEALQAVLSDIQQRSIDVIACLGDIVGYYPDPNSCVQLIQKYNILAVAGNHDYAAIGRIKTHNFTYYAYEAMDWTKKNLSTESKQFLESLPLRMEMNGLFLTHSSPSSPERFSYIFPSSEKTVISAFTAMAHRLNFIGHTHWPFVICRPADSHSIEVHEEPKAEADHGHSHTKLNHPIHLPDGSVIHRLTDVNTIINPNSYYLINVGSVGQPRNHDYRCCYVVYDSDDAGVTFIRVHYDYTVTQRKVIDNSLPSFLAERLAKGK
ncbi:MAG: metallophosphoesterase family protein [Chitinivibrionales bacterium]|nr:metallophosphoesterase family protein [Chitinivibrionales bacterium]